METTTKTPRIRLEFRRNSQSEEWTLLPAGNVDRTITQPMVRDLNLALGWDKYRVAHA